ncbi:sigma-54 interaction domain-containing protein [Congregibacter litoralis]|uniref:sigma-54 interaction domain-containing protein n=1 Tax=Congregibacter litoralis TaxID=393662 RepID=UPI00146FAD4E|nr:sigma-54 dependent transcriptional regulator [Congregibacter litoralis]
MDQAASPEFVSSLACDDVDVAFLDTGLGLTSLSCLSDDGLAGAELFAMAGEDDPQLADACIRAGFGFYFCKPLAAVSVSGLLEDINEELSSQNAFTEGVEPDLALDQFGLMRGSSRPMRKLFRMLRKVGPTETTVLIVGESGTGKELVAETLHTLSNRSDQPYLTLNCSALAENLIESELFGHEKGSFSGAHKQHIGFFERAHGGTLFLDEITEMQPDLQSKLLRALESGEIRRVGAVDPIRVDVRVVAATNRDPLLAVEEGILREDLYYRLAHISVHVPPLRRRGGDVKGLAHFFLAQLNEEHGTSIKLGEEALAEISNYDWPGNVRQLRHSIERAYIVSESTVEASAFALHAHATPVSLMEGLIPITVGMSLADCEREIITANLKHNDGDKKETARILGVSVKTLYNRLRDYDNDTSASSVIDESLDSALS